MTDLATGLASVCAAAFEAEGLEARWGSVKRSDRPELADFQCNGCMGAAKQAGMNPRELAAKIAPRIAEYANVARVDVAGPGFLNIVVTETALAEVAEAVRVDPKAGGAGAANPEKVVIDYGGPNVAKPMHVGHLRAAVIGDTMVRLLRFMGDEVIGDVHLGDWGLQMGLLIVAVMEEQPGLPYFDASNDGPFPADPPVTMEDLSRLYPLASARAKDDEAYAKQAQEAVAEMQAGRAGYRALLKHFIQVSVAALKVDYAFLDVSFNLWKGESDIDPLIAPMVADLKDRGLARLDDGAWIIDIERGSDKKDMPPFMLVNSRGATGYHTTDLATIVDRVETIGPDRILYVVDARQAFHFEQVFRASDKAGIMAEGRLEHIGFGTVNGDDGKPFKTRAGGTLRLADLNNAALKAARLKVMRVDADTGRKIIQESVLDAVIFYLKAKKYKADKKYVINKIIDTFDFISGEVNFDLIKSLKDKPPEERRVIRDARKKVDEIAKYIARAALRFADLKNQRTTNYVFELEKFSSFEGKTGPYLLYAVVRLRSLLRRAAEAGHAPGAIKVESAAERKLVLALDGFTLALSLAREKRMPHFVCEHVYGLAQAFSAFYGAHPIAKEADAAVRASRLGLCEAVLAQMIAGLGILGITAPERM